MPTEGINVRAVFDRAVEFGTEAERAAYLDQACANFPEIRREVESLLEAHSDAGSFLQSPAAGPATTVLSSARNDLVGTQIGPYKLLQQIGEGGMGIVYMAQQDHPVQRTVALKIIKPGMDTSQVIARFEAERQALALMDHPNICHVLDAGTTTPTDAGYPGRPYFVMELVKGTPIIQYADEHRLTPRQRLELFIPVCQAIQHAHQKGIIHRDLKPTNVLVADYDNHPVPKVIDFGVAKAIGQHLTEKTLFTQFGQIVGTVEYMSPEQAKLNQLDIDTRTDIYSLGVLLYELLTGETPFDRQRLRSAAFDEVLRIIREEDPPKPSTRLSTAAQLPMIAANRGSEPKRLTCALRGELDWIVMKALEKDRNRRYDTANGLARDVERYLRDDPVEACPPSASYRFGKFVRRNKTTLAATSAILFLLVLFGAGVGWMSRDRAVRQQVVEDAASRALKEADELQGRDKWQEALTAAERAQAALASGEAGAQLQQQINERVLDLRMIQRLEELRLEIGDDLDSENRDRAYARVFTELGIDADSLSPSEIAERIRRRPATAVRMAAALDHWSKVRRDKLLRQKGDPATWKRLLEAAQLADPDSWRDKLRQMIAQEDLNGLRQLAKTADVPTLPAQSLDLLANALVFGGDRQACVECLRRVQREHPGDVIINFDLAFHLSDSPSPPWNDVVRYFQAALAARPQSGRLHQDFAFTLLKAGQLDEARAMVFRALALKTYDAGARNILSVLAVRYAAVGRVADALSVIDELLARPIEQDGNMVCESQTAVDCTRQFKTLQDAAACRAAAKALENKKPLDARSRYNIACCWALAAAARDEIADDYHSMHLVTDDVNHAIEWLKNAVASGFADPADMRQDRDIDFIRNRPEFRQLLAEVEHQASPIARARSYILLSQWDKAAAECVKIEWSPPLADDAYSCACLFLVRKDSDGYKSFCQSLIQRLPQPEGADAYVLTRICTISRTSPVDSGRPLQWANTNLVGSHNPWDFHALGMAQYRAGQFDVALQSFNKALDKRNNRYAELTWFALALVHQRLGHSDEARQCLDKGNQYMTRMGPSGPGQPARLLPQDWLETQLLRREAEELGIAKSNP
jgi:serine/threonine protein kinase